MPLDGGRRRVVIVGGGFAGLAAAQGLRQADVDVTVVDRMNHHLFQPLLYQVAAGVLSAGDCGSAIRGQLKRQPNATVLMAEVTDVEPGAKEVTLSTGERLGYDSLIVACGAETSYFGNDEWKDVSFGLKTLRDAVELRDQIVSAFEQAERELDPQAREEWLTFAVVGGGPTGVEVAGQLAIIAETMKREFSRIDPSKAKVILVDAGERVLPAFSEKLSAKAAEALVSLGVTVREGLMATAIDEEGLTVKAGDREERMAARTVIWAAGVRAAGLTAVLAEATGASTDRGGRIDVNPDCTVPGHPEISVIGDMANHKAPDGKPLPGLATVAIQQAHHVSKAIRRGQPGASTPFRYLDKGALAVVGRGKAICQVRSVELWGLPAFAMYLSVHLYYLSGAAGTRLRVVDAWTTARSGRRAGWVSGDELPVDEPAPATGQAPTR